ncbi:patatin-like phospholipase family protein [Aquiflexum sp.]|uniref:patatin-like phospholipase family protein n=1 Tax=Aquiflexum sp. TaxID=1872584 RepID=UPI0035934C8A
MKNKFDDHYRDLLSNLFGEMEESSLRQIFEAGKKIKLEAGEYLFKQGDSQNELYVVLSGRLRAINESKSGTVILGDIAEGEPVGEIALFTNEPRMAAVLAIRKSIVLEISKAEYHNAVAKNPEFASALTRFVINRMRRNILEQKVEAIPKNIVIFQLQQDLNMDYWVSEIKSNLETMHIPTQILGGESKGEKNSKELPELLEQHKGVNLIVCSGQDSDWTKQCLLYADLVILATYFYADSDLYEIEKAQKLYENNILNRKKYLLLLHPENVDVPDNSAKWFKDRNIHLHIHARKNNNKDMRRLCRIITNQAVGLVLGGSGAKGYAHVGAVQALLEAGVEIDFVGGSSAGALYGIIMAFADFQNKRIEAICQQSAESDLGINNFFLTFFAKNSSQKIEEFSQKVFGNTALEDLWVNSYCVSTDMTNNEVKIHSTGKVWQQVRESFLSPGIFPPVVVDDQVYMDSAMADNIPIDPMYRYPVKNIIAVSLSGSEPEKVDFKNVPSVWEQVKGKFAKKKRYDNPVITTVMVNSMTFNSRQREEINKSKVSLFFEINLRAVSLLDDSKWKRVVKKGHDQTKSYLNELPGEEKFWLKNS